MDNDEDYPDPFEGLGPDEVPELSEDSKRRGIRYPTESERARLLKALSEIEFDEDEQADS